MSRGIKIFVVLIVLVVSILIACTETQEPAQADVQYDINKVGNLGAESGAGKHGELWQDTNGCYWIYDKGGFKQIFESSRNSYSDTKPYCGRVE